MSAVSQNSVYSFAANRQNDFLQSVTIKIKSSKRISEEETADPEKKPKKAPHTLETLREKDATIPDADDEEALLDEAEDELAPYFKRESVPKILITTSDKARKVCQSRTTLETYANFYFLQRTIQLAREIAQVVPNAEYRSRRRFALKKIVPECIAHGVTDLVIINENRDVPDALTLCHLPDGPTAVFKLRSVKLMKEIKVFLN